MNYFRLLLQWFLRRWQPPQKKLIQYSKIDSSTEDLAKLIPHLDGIFDGIACKLGTDNQPKQIFDTRPWANISLWTKQMRILRQVKWHRLTDNFIHLRSTNKWKMSWFNNCHWSTIAANMRMIGRLIKLTRPVGVLWDPEPYGPNPWAYKGVYDTKSFEEVQIQVRIRGEQWMRALRSELSYIRVLSLFCLSRFSSIIGGQDKLKDHKYALLPSFICGMLTALGGRSQLIDGNEPSYYYTGALRYPKARDFILEGVLPLVPEEYRDSYTKMKIGHAVHLEHILDGRGDSTPSWSIAPYMSEQERLALLEHNVYYGLKEADQYCWVYDIGFDWTERTQAAVKIIHAIQSGRRKALADEELGFTVTASVLQARRARNEANKKE